ncbi:hypothetical protein JVU11DRAFT_1889 [Chiua virens]|nr:hypothetical protein JVU11DRAFT_1889 [Chiua virens]
MIDSKPSGGAASAASRAPMSAPVLPSSGGPPQLGGLFAGGIPKLKPAGQGNLAKPPTLGKPPAVPGRAVPSPVPSAPPPPSRMTPPKPSMAAPPPLSSAPPSRPAPALPSRAPSIPARAPPPPARVTPSPPAIALAPPRRPPPPPRAASPPAPPPAWPPTSAAARSVFATEISSSGARVPPSPPARSGNGVPTLPARKAPPPPPARPCSIAGSMPSRVPPPPPTRKALTTNGPSALPVHMRAVSDTETSTLPPPPPPPGSSPARMNLLAPTGPVPPTSQRPRVVSTPVPAEAPSRPSTSSPNHQTNGTRRPPPTRKIPSPPPAAGSHIFPTIDFPPPRHFTPEARHYGGGRLRGSDFDLSSI